MTSYSQTSGNKHYPDDFWAQLLVSSLAEYHMSFILSIMVRISVEELQQGMLYRDRLVARQ